MTALGTIDWVARARDLAPLITASIPRMDAECQLPPELDAALREAGMYRLLIPRAFGGAEIDPITLIDVIETLAGIDASTAWVVGQVTATAMSSAYLEPAVARDIFGTTEGVLAWGPPKRGATIRADVVDDGYRCNGTWNFASGSRHANWLGAMTPVFERDGKQRMNPDGKPEIRTILFPKTSAVMTDIWQVTGLRGTGSDQLAITDLFVPDKLSFTRDLAGRREYGPLYRLSMVYLHAVSFAAVAIGIARASLDAFVEVAKVKRPARGGFGQPMKENNAIQAHIGFAEAQLRAAHAYLVAAMRDGIAEAATIAEGQISMATRIDMRAASTFGIGLAEQVANLATRLAGTNAIFESEPFERRFRDIHTVTQQAQAHLSNYESIGQYRLGSPMDLMI